LARKFGLAAASIGMVGCRDRQASVPALPELRLLSWSRFFDPALLSHFEELNRCRIKASYFETNEELFTRLDANPSDFDIVTPSSYMTPRLVAEGKLLELGTAELNLKSTSAIIAGREIEVPARSHAIAFSWSAAGVASYQHHGEMKTNTWRVFENPAIKGRFTLLKDMRELLGAGLKACGRSANSALRADLLAARDIVARWLASARGLENETYSMALIAGQDFAAHAYNGDIWIARKADSAIRFTLPDEGTTIAMDQICISAGCVDSDLAHAFIRFICEPDQARRNMEWSGYMSVNPEVIALSPEVEKAILGEFSPALTQSEVLIDLGTDTQEMEALWQSLFAF
jgi:spermidine/putrescine-binding protein